MVYLVKLRIKYLNLYHLSINGVVSRQVVSVSDYDQMVWSMSHGRLKIVIDMKISRWAHSVLQETD